MSIKGGNQKVESIEVSGKSVDETVIQALSRLGKRRDEVEITVLQMPSRGAFGIGSKEARVRVSVRTGNLSAVITPEMADAILGPDETFPEEELYMEEEEEGEFEDEDEEELEEATREDVEITVDVLQHILRYMNIHATVQVRSNNPLTLNIHGIHENLGLLIGRRGETLAALQLLVSLIVGHRTKHRMRIVVDAENYRERREENL